MGIPEKKKERKKGTKEVSKTIISENFSKLILDTKSHLWEAQRTQI